MIEAKLFILDQEIELLWTDMYYHRNISRSGMPRSNIMGGLITVCFETGKYSDQILCWMASHSRDNTWGEVDKMKKGHLCFYKNGFDYPPTKTYQFNDSHIVYYKEIFDANNEESMQTIITISPAIQNYGTNSPTKENHKTDFVQPWNVSWIPYEERKPYQVKEAESPVAVKQEEKAVIQSVDLLHESDDTPASRDVIQYVNLPVNIDFTDKAKGVYQNRLSQKLKVKITFNKQGKHNFKLKLKPNNGNVNYSANELMRNPNFKHMDQELSFTTDSNGEKILKNEVFVSAAGGDSFIVVASDEQGNNVESPKVETKRKLYYVEAKMQNLTSIVSSLNTFTSEYDKHNIECEAFPSFHIPHMPNIGNATDSNAFKNSVRAGYASSSGSSKNPHCVVIAYTDHLAVKNTNRSLAISSVHAGVSTPINIAIEGRGIDQLRDPTIKRRALWNNLISGEDWFIECYFIKNGGNPTTDKIPIPKSRCSPIQKAGYPIGYYDSVDIDVSWLPAETGTITLKVNWVDRMRGGLSFRGTNIVAICTKSWWQTRSELDQNQVIVHEVGHQLGMVANGNGILPTKTSYHYDNSKGHKGNHCHAGIPVGQTRYDSRTDKGISTCVMYGATNGKSAFCSECAKALKKVDLINGVL